MRDQPIDLQLQYVFDYADSDSGTEDSGREDIAWNSRWTLTTNTGWQRIIPEQTADQYDTWQYDEAGVLTATTGSSSEEGHYTGLVFLDLRVTPPVMVWEEYHAHTEDKWAGYQEWRGGPMIYTTSTSSFWQEERLALFVEDVVQPVTEWRELTTEEPAVFWLPSFFRSPLVFEAPYVSIGGSFVAGQTTTDSLVLGDYRNPRVQYQFMVPQGDLPTYGGGPVGR
ncbi:MAG: hypothetical protein EXR78_08585 [Deltaproteobacteria bacterium]|nr:hypothetical protein [Deltaproteobacteria bacterium]